MGYRSTAIGASGARTAVVRIDYPVQLTHPKLQEFAVMAAWLSVLAETARELEDLLADVPPEERQLPDFRTRWPWYFHDLAITHFVVQGSREEGEQLLAEQLAPWIAEDRENWPVVRLTLIDPWQERPDLWSEETREGVRILVTCATTA